MRGTLVRKTWTHSPHLYAPQRYRKACSYEAFIPAPIAAFKLRLPGTLAATISDAEAAISRLNAMTPGHLAPLAHLLLRTESIASSKVEGLQIDARSLARSEAKYESGRRIGADAVEILGSIDAMELAVEQAVDGRDIGVGDLQEIHAALVARSAPAIAGKIRDVQNWIGGNDYNPCGATFVPPPPESVPPLLADLCTFCNGDGLPPLVQAAIAHAQFETIHPFEDGNGRTGRALVQVILRRREIAPAYVPPISVMLAKHKDTYIHGLKLFREDDIDGWLATFAESTAAASLLAQRYLGLVDDLLRHWRQQLSAIQPRSDAAAWAIIDVLPAHPVITVNTAMAATGRTRPAAVNAIEQLAACGVLVPISDSARNRAWEAVGLLDLIAGLEEGA
jgi:Fic family protein